MDIAARFDDFGKPILIALTILGFIFCWPVGLALLAVLIWSKRMGCGRHGGWGRWHHGGDRLRDMADRWHRSNGSGNRAFDEYRAETLRRLEEEQKDFREFLDRLRFAKDKSEFDEFLAERRRRSETPPAPSPS